MKNDAYGVTLEKPIDSTVTLNVMKALLSMNQYVLLISYGGLESIRDIQSINRNYEDYVGLILVSTIHKKGITDAFLIPTLEEGKQEEGKEEVISKKEQISLENIDARLMTIDDFLK